MGFKDFLGQVDTARVVTASGVSGSSIDLGAAIKSDDVVFDVNVSAVSGTTPTLAVEVIGADDAALTTNVVSMGRIDPVVASGMAAKSFYVDGTILTKKRFLGLRYTVGGTTPSFTITSAVSSGRQRDYSQN